MQTIPGFERYTIDELGRVFSYHMGKYLSLTFDQDGYHQVGLHKDGKQTTVRIARLVAQAFIPNPENKSQVNHKDGNKTNDLKSNLEWTTRSENMQHAFAAGLAVRSPDSGITPMPVTAHDYKTGVCKSSHASLLAAADFYGLHVGNVSKVVNGKIKHTHGLTFKKI